MDRNRVASLRTLALLVLISPFVACSGGGGGGGPGADVTITSANANQVAASAYAAGTGNVFDSTSVAGGVVFARVEGEDPTPMRFDLRRFAERWIKGIVPSSVRPVVYVENGSEGGTATVDWHDVAPVDVVSTGDTFDITFADYQEDGVRLNGSISITGVVVTGDPELDPTWRVGCTINFANVLVTELGVSATINGAVGGSAEQTATQFILLLNVNGDLTSGDEVVYAGFALDYRETDATGTFTLNTSGLSKDPALAGTSGQGVFSFATTTPFGGNSIDDYPSSGVLIVHGANSAVRLTALSNVDVMLEIDADGDGTFEENRTVTWVSLDS